MEIKKTMSEEVKEELEHIFTGGMTEENFNKLMEYANTLKKNNFSIAHDFITVVKNIGSYYGFDIFKYASWSFEITKDDLDILYCGMWMIDNPIPSSYDD